MSVLKREICKNENTPFVPFAEETQFDVQGIKECNESRDDDDDDFHEEDFEEPSSLKSLPDNKRSTMSDDSDALFHSAELDFPGDENFGGIRTPKSNKSGSGGKSGSSPIAIKGGSTSYHKLSTRSLGYNDPATNEKTSVYSLPLIMTTDTTGSSVCSENPSPASTGSNVNARSLSEAIKTTQVIENILDAPDLVKTTKQGISQLREQFRDIHSELMVSQQDFQMNVGEMKQRLVDILTEAQDAADCSKCHLLREKHVTENVELNKELNGLKDKYLEVISEKDRMCMEIKSLEEKCVSCKDENERLREEKNASKEEHDAQVASLQAEIIKNGNVMGQLNKQIEELNSKIQNNAGNGTVIGELSKQIEELNGKLKGKDQYLDDVCAERDSLAEALKKNSLEIAEKNRELSELVLGKDKLVNECAASKEQLEKITIEYETFKLSRQQSIDGHLEQVSTSQIQLKECKRSEKENLALIKELEQKIHKLEAVISEKNTEMADKDEQLTELLQRKGSLEAQNQSNFNFVLNKIRKEKDTQINELKDKINTTEKELVSHRSKNETLLLEITVHKSAYNEIQEQLETEKDKFAQYETSLAASVAQVDTLTAELTEARENNVSLNAEKLRVIQELKVQYDEALEKEKKQLLLQFELDKESALEEFGKSDNVRAKSMSIEEGMDELELEGLVQEVKALKEENHKLKSGQSSSASCDGTSQSLISKLKSHQLVVRTIESGSLVIICLDESINQYTVLHLTTNKYFLHPDSLKVVRKILEKPGEERRWMFAYVAEIEICVCRKPQNKFNLPVNSYFTRIRVNPHEMENCS